MTYIKITMGYLWDIHGITSYDVPEAWLKVHVVIQTFWHVEGVTTGLHHSSAWLGLSFITSEKVQRATISVRHLMPV